MQAHFARVRGLPDRRHEDSRNCDPDGEMHRTQSSPGSRAGLTSPVARAPCTREVRQAEGKQLAEGHFDRPAEEIVEEGGAEEPAEAAEEDEAMEAEDSSAVACGFSRRVRAQAI